MYGDPIKETVFAVLQKDGEGPGRTEIRLVSWNDRPAVLEKRQFILDRATNKERTGRAKGFLWCEMKMLVEKWAELDALYKKAGETGIPEGKGVPAQKPAGRAKAARAARA